MNEVRTLHPTPEMRAGVTAYFPVNVLNPHASASRATSSAQPQDSVTPAPPWP